MAKQGEYLRLSTKKIVTPGLVSEDSRSSAAQQSLEVSNHKSQRSCASMPWKLIAEIRRKVSSINLAPGSDRTTWHIMSRETQGKSSFNSQLRQKSANRIKRLLLTHASNFYSVKVKDKQCKEDGEIR